MYSFRVVWFVLCCGDPRAIYPLSLLQSSHITVLAEAMCAEKASPCLEYVYAVKMNLFPNSVTELGYLIAKWLVGLLRCGIKNSVLDFPIGRSSIIWW